MQTMYALWNTRWRWWFLSEDKTYCRLDNSLKKDEDECSNLKLDEKTLKNVLRDVGIFNTRIV